MNITTIESKGQLVKGTNVRRSEAESEVWRATGQPMPLRNDAWHPLQQVALSGTAHNAIFMLNGTLLGVITCANKPTDGNQPPESKLTQQVVEIGAINGEPLHFDVVEAGIVKVLMRHQRTIYLTYKLPLKNGEHPTGFTLHGTMPDLPEPTLSVGYETNLSEHFTGCTLSGTHDNRTTLTTSDTKTVTAHLLWAYTCLRRKGDEAGLMLQPTIARCRLLDAAGDTIATGAPVLLCSDAGFQCCSDINLSSTDNLATLSGGALAARGYRASVTIPKALTFPWNRIVRSLVVESTGQLTPIDGTQLCQSHITNNGATTTVRLRLPGVSTSAEANASRRQSLVMQALSENAYGQQAIIRNPFSEAGKHSIALNDVECHRMPQFTPLRDARSYRTALHSHAHNTLILADTCTEPFNGHSPLSLTTSLDAAEGASWQAVSTVKIVRPDGSETIAVVPSIGFGTQIGGFSPLLTYPDANACQLTLSIETTDAKGVRATLTETYRLTAVPGCDMAFHLADTFPNIMPRASAGTLTIPQSTVAAQVATGTIDICPAHLTTAPYSRFSCGHGAIVAIVDAPRSRATWDFARRKLLIFGEDGIGLATVDANHTLRSATTLDPRPVLKPHNICHANRGHGLEYLAVAGGDLISVSQSTVSTLMRNCPGEMPGWDATHAEIWLINSMGIANRISFYHRQAECISVALSQNDKFLAPLQWNGKLLLPTDTSLLNGCAESYPPDGIGCFLSVRHQIPGHTQYVRQLRLPIFAEKIVGKIIISGDNGSHVAEPLVTLNVDGQLNVPIHATMLSPKRQWIETTIDARVSGDAEFRPPMIICQ